MLAPRRPRSAETNFVSAGAQLSTSYLFHCATILMSTPTPPNQMDHSALQTEFPKPTTELSHTAPDNATMAMPAPTIATEPSPWTVPPPTAQPAIQTPPEHSPLFAAEDLPPTVNATSHMDSVAVPPVTATPPPPHLDRAENTDPRVAPLKAMFPDFDSAVLLYVLEAENGNQDRAIDTLLAMSDPNYIPQASQSHAPQPVSVYIAVLRS